MWALPYWHCDWVGRRMGHLHWLLLHYATLLYAVLACFGCLLFPNTAVLRHYRWLILVLIGIGFSLTLRHIDRYLAGFIRNGGHLLGHSPNYHSIDHYPARHIRLSNVDAFLAINCVIDWSCLSHFLLCFQLLFLLGRFQTDRAFFSNSLFVYLSS